MGLRKAYEAVIEDILQNNHGGISEENLERADVEKLAKQFSNSDEFLTRMTDSLEDLVEEYIDDFGDEYGLW